MGAEITHGLRSTYVNKECRCDPCTKANADYKLITTTNNRNSTSASAAAFSEAFGDEEIPILTHGLRSTYEWWGCRCEACRKVMRPIWREARRKRRNLDRLLRLVS